MVAVKISFYTLLLVYALTSFITLNYNPLEWYYEARVVSVSIWSAILSIVWLIYIISTIS